MATDPTIKQWLSILGVQYLATTDDILSGNTVHHILIKTLDNYQQQFLTPPSDHKIINWNNILKFLSVININIQTQEKAKIYQGDLKSVQNLLLKLKSFLQNTKQQSVDLNKIDPKSNPQQTKSLLELFVVILTRNLHISVKESVALLQSDSKYLAHVMAKGFREQVAPVVSLLGDFQTYLPKIKLFCMNKENQIFFMKSIKPGLISRYRQVSQVSLQILLQFALESQNPVETMRIHLISTFVLQYRRHPCLIGQICAAIVKISNFSKNLLIILSSDLSQKQFLVFSYELLCIGQNLNQLKKFYAMAKVDQLLNICILSLIETNDFQIGLLILIKIIQTNSALMETDPQKLSRMVTNLQRLVITKKLQTIALVNGLFGIFNVCWKQNFSVTPDFYRLILYKYKLAFTQDQSVMYCHNFVTLVQEIPIFTGNMASMLAEAIVDKFELEKESIREMDLELLLGAVRILFKNFSKQGGEKQPINYDQNKQVLLLNEQNALRIMNVCSQIFLQETQSPVTISNILITVIELFVSSPAMIQSTLRVVKVSLAIYFANIRKLSVSKPKSTRLTNIIDQSNVSIKLKNLNIEYFLQLLLSLKNPEINSNSQPLLCYTYVQADSKCPRQAAGLGTIIQSLGNLNSLIQKYADDVKHIQKSKKSSGKLSPNYQLQEDREEKVASPDFYNKKIMAPGQSYADYINKVSKVTDNAQKGIQKFHKVFQDKKRKALQDELRKIEQEQRMEQIQRKFTHKLLQKGVKINPKIQSLNKYFYEFNTKQAQIMKEVSYQLRSLHMFNPLEEETNDIEGMRYVLKKYNKILRVFYSHYGGKIKTTPTGLIEEQTQKQHLLNLPSVWKLLKDYELDGLITIKEVQFLVHKLNSQKKKGYNDPNLLDFQIFEDFIVQSSFTMFTRPPKDLSGYTIAGMIQETFYQFKMLAGENKIDVRLFVDELALVEQDESIAALNIELKRNPDYILPEGYKKIVEKKVQYYHSLSSNVLGQSYTDVLDVLDEIIYEKFKFHIIEPFSEVVTNIFAKSLLSKKKEDIQDSKEKYFSLNVKKQLFKYSGEDRRIARQVAFCLSQIVDGVQHGKKIVPKNKITYKQSQEQKKRADQEQQKKRQKRDHQIKKALQLQRQQRQQKRKQQQYERTKEIQKTQEQKMKKKQYEQELKKKVEQYHQKKQIDRKKEEQEKNKEKLKEQQVYLKKRKEYLKFTKEIEKEKEKQFAKETLDKAGKAINEANLPIRQKSKTLLRVSTKPQLLKGREMSTKKLQPNKQGANLHQKNKEAINKINGPISQEPKTKKLEPNGKGKDQVLINKKND